MSGILVLLGLMISTSVAADSVAGRAVADAVCTSCHIVSTNQEVVPIYGKSLPSFAEIAARPGISRKEIARILLGTDHPRQPTGMPFVGLTEAEVQDVAQYVLTLRPPTARR